MSVGDEVHAIRHAAALSDEPHVARVRLVGEDAFDVLDALCPALLFIRDGQMLHTLLLREDARVLADLYVCSDDEDFLLLAEGPTEAELVEHLRAHFPTGCNAAVEPLGESHDLLSLNGPYAWELLSKLLGSEVVGLPYMTFFHDGELTCLRAGKTGEFGYHLLVPRDAAERVRERFSEASREMDLDLVWAGLEALDQCALENWFFNVRREGRAAVTPIELQLQWRVSYRKDYVGSAALRERRRTGPARRLTCLVSRSELELGAAIVREEETVGELVNAGFCQLRDEWVGLALLALPYARSGVDGCEALVRGRRRPVRTVSPPVIDNRSLFIDLQRHCWQTRARDEFPPLVAG